MLINAMASAEIQVANPCTLSKIERFLNDSTYRETIENSANYNTRLCIDRRMRMPFLDSQTGKIDSFSLTQFELLEKRKDTSNKIEIHGEVEDLVWYRVSYKSVAQNHSNLFMSARERLPGLVEGQIYSYPSKCWRKKRRQYLMTYMQPCLKELEHPDIDLHTISTVENPAALNEDSKDSMHLKDETAKDAWYYDELDMQDVEGYDDRDPDSDYDFEESYSKRKRRRGGKVSGRGGGRGRKKATPSYDILTDAEKPFSCELCGARYKTRPGLTYHYTHSHKECDDEDDSSSANNSSSIASSSGGGGGSSSTTTAVTAPSPKPLRDSPAISSTGLSMGMIGSTSAGTSNNNGGKTSGHHHTPGTRRGQQPGSLKTPTLVQVVSDDSATAGTLSEHKKASVSQSKQPITSSSSSSSTPNLSNRVEGGGGIKRDQANPSSYCDFCLGDAQENKKTGVSEELVSCSDCGRSGHPSCLQFTANMIISVRKYRWQCIECKCCSLCGNSDNDDQLLFCDDCDRGYHMYCLNPPLTSPPEGSWSCMLCVGEFHKK